MASDTRIVDWPDMRQVAQEVDDLADSLGVASQLGVTKLTLDPESPFSLEDAYPVSFYYHFEVIEKSTPPSVVDHYAKNGPYDVGATLRLGPPFDKLAEQGELFFVHQKDDCWCKTLFRVVKQENDDKVQLFEIGDGGDNPQSASRDPEIGCCQSLRIPDVSDLLDYSQYIIPAAAAEFYSAGVPDTLIWKVFPKCVAMPTGVVFHFRPERTGGSVLIGAARQMTGKLVWPIRKKWMDMLETRLSLILSFTAAKSNLSWPRAEDTDSWFGPYNYGLRNLGYGYGCTPDLDVLINSAVMHGNSLDDRPGCISVRNAPNTTYVDEFWELCRPWRSNCCNEKKCGEKYRVYKNTLTQLKLLISQIPSRVSGVPVGASDCCGITVDTGSYDGDFDGPSKTWNIALPSAVEYKARCPHVGGGASLMYSLNLNLQGGWVSFSMDGSPHCAPGDYTCLYYNNFSKTGTPGGTVHLEVRGSLFQSFRQASWQLYAVAYIVPAP